MQSLNKKYINKECVEINSIISNLTFDVFSI